MDIFSDVLRRLHLRGGAYFCYDFHGAWGMEENADTRGSFHIIVNGHASIQVGDAPIHAIKSGDIVVLPHGSAHWIADQPRSLRLPGDQVIEAILNDQTPFSEGPDVTTLMCGYFEYDSHIPHPVLKSLPELMILETGAKDENGWLVSAVRALSIETRNREPGVEVLVDRLTEIMLIAAFRRWMQQSPNMPGFLGALADPHLASVFDSIHQYPGNQWTVVKLAQVAGMSRAAFAQTFQNKVGQSPITYLRHWRMTLAREWFQEGASILDVALSIGYRSEAAFSKAFKKVQGVTPGEVRRQQPNLKNAHLNGPN